MEYIYMIIRYKIIQDFKGICIAVKADEQVFVLCVIIRGFVQKTVVYSRIKSLANVGLVHAMLESIRIEINNKIHVPIIPLFTAFFKQLLPLKPRRGR